jgi:hypothetical protein
MVRERHPEDLVRVVDAVRAGSIDPCAMELGWNGSEAILLMRRLGSEQGVAAFSKQIASVAGPTEVDAASVPSVVRRTRRAVETTRRPLRFVGGPAELGSLLGRARRWCEQTERPFAGWSVADRALVALAHEGGSERPGGGAGSEPNAPWGRGIKRLFDPRGALPSGPFGANVARPPRADHRDDSGPSSPVPS